MISLKPPGGRLRPFWDPLIQDLQKIITTILNVDFPKKSIKYSPIIWKMSKEAQIQIDKEQILLDEHVNEL